MTTASKDDPWADERVARWLRQAPDLEHRLGPVADVLFAAAALQPGERVLDVGCGTGPTTRRAAREVGPTGHVVGLDIADAMLAAAAAEPVEDGAAPLEWVTADVVGWQPDGHPVDVVISRFGVMFFSDPAVAFATLAAATRPGGRLALAVWASRDESDAFAVPLRAALAALQRRGAAVEIPPHDGGPFSLHDPATVTTLLTEAGWSDVRCTPHQLTLPFAGGQDAVAASTLDLGPVRLVADQVDDDDRAAIVTAISAALADHLDGDGQINLGALIKVITANRP